MRYKSRHIFFEGLAAGLLGASIVAVWFLMIDLSSGHALATPALLGAALLPSAATRVPLLLVAQYSVFHFAAFAVFGLIAAALLQAAEQHPVFLSGVLLLFCGFELFFLGLVGVVSQATLETLIWWRIVTANILATVVMGAFFAFRHQWLVGRARTKWRLRFGLPSPRVARVGAVIDKSVPR